MCDKGYRGVAAPMTPAVRACWSRACAALTNPALQKSTAIVNVQIRKWEITSKNVYNFDPVICFDTFFVLNKHYFQLDRVRKGGTPLPGRGHRGRSPLSRHAPIIAETKGEQAKKQYRCVFQEAPSRFAGENQYIQTTSIDISSF